MKYKIGYGDPLYYKVEEAFEEKKKSNGLFCGKIHKKLSDKLFEECSNMVKKRFEEAYLVEFTATVGRRSDYFFEVVQKSPYIV